ncbi:MAG: DUF126 domain-containing protein [Vicinamibacterales bacterium]
MTRPVRVLSAGRGQGVALVLLEPVSFWGGVDPATGRLIDRSHPQHGESVAGRVLVMAVGRGSSSSSAVLAESIRLGTAPAAIVLAHPDPILTVGAIVAEFLYGRRCPVVVGAIEGIETGLRIVVEADAPDAARLRVGPASVDASDATHTS